MKTKDTYERVKIAAALIGIGAGWLIIWKLLQCFMWLCYEAGFKM